LTAFCDATIFTGESLTEGHALLAQNGRITDIVAMKRIPADAARIDCADKVLAPGFIDAQVNGGGNLLYNNAPTAETACAIAAAHAKYGTTRLLLTCISDTPQVTRQAIAALREARRENKNILGSERRGVHKPEHLRALTDEDVKLYRREGDEIMLVTLAPENAAPAQIETLRKNGVIVSLGHTGAAADALRTSLGAGTTGFTHLFNGMGPMSARAPGPAGVALDDRDSWCSIIADGHHVSPELIRLACRAKPPGKMFLVSDAMPPAATDIPEPFELYGETIRAENGRCVNKDGRLAGSAITMFDAVSHCVANVGLGLEETLRMASAYPAAFLGIDKNFGRLLPGFAADIVVLDPALALHGVWVGGIAVV
jgi:N-acetylglucosamine-6-phosphate deacetylase